MAVSALFGARVGGAEDGFREARVGSNARDAVAGKKWRGRWIAAGAALMLCAGAATGGPAAADTRRFITGWLPGWVADVALAATAANADLFNEASPFWFAASANAGTVTISSNATDAVRARTVATLHELGVPVIPAVQDGSAAHAMAAILADPTARSAHARQLVALAVDSGYDGIELDYEKFAFGDGSGSWASTRPNWVAFVAELATGLHEQGKRLAIASPPIYAAGQVGASGYWVYDFASIAGSVDSLRIMAYDYSVALPGPIAPLAFVRRSLDYAVTVVPPEKIRVGIPAYGRVWTARNADGSAAVNGVCPVGAVPATKSFSNQAALATLSEMAGAPVTPTWNEEFAEQTVTFTRTYSGKTSSGADTSCDVTHVAWWPAAAGTMARLAIMDEYHLGGAALWHLAGVDGATWDAVRAYAGGATAIATPPPAPAPSPSPTPNLTPSPTVSATAAPSVTPKPPTPALAATSVKLTAPTRARANQKVTIKVTAWSSAQIPAKVKVRLSRRNAGSKKWVTVATTKTSAKGNATFKARVGTRTATWRATVAGSAKRTPGQGSATITVTKK